MDEVALKLPSLTLFVKNDLTGEFEPALVKVERLNTLRAENFDDPAPVALMYRGGENYRTPDRWEDQRNAALEASGGIMIDDLAHGTEMAHDPEGNFQKSAQGQMNATDHIIDLWERGYASSGTLAEGSDSPEKVDPHEPFAFALGAMKRLIEIKKQLYLPVGVRAHRHAHSERLGYNSL
jgi:hypothetical protein